MPLLRKLRQGAAKYHAAYRSDRSPPGYRMSKLLLSHGLPPTVEKFTFINFQLFKSFLNNDVYTVIRMY